MAPLPHCNLKTAHDTVTKIDTKMYFDVIMMSSCWSIGKIQIPSIFPLRRKILKEWIKKLANTSINFNNSGGVMMTSLIVKEGSKPIRHLASVILN